MDNSTNKFNLYYFLTEIHNLASEIRENRSIDIEFLCAQFSLSSLDETISMAKTLAFASDDPAFREDQLQLKSDITILTEYLIHTKVDWRPAAILHKIFRQLFGLHIPEEERHSGSVSRTTLREALDFLNDFAPNRAFSFQGELKSKPVQVIFQKVIDEIELHIGEIAKAIAKRHEQLSMYLQPGTFNKLIRIKKNISFLIQLLAGRVFKEPEKSSMLVYGGLSESRDFTDVETKTINLLKRLHDDVASCFRSQRKHIESWQSKTLSEFMKNCSDGGEVRAEPVLTQLSLYLQSEIPTDWFYALKKNPMVCMEIQTFCSQFLREEEHGAKIRLFHNFLSEWLEKYPPDSKVGAEELLVYIQSILLLAGSPELLLDILLLEGDSISFQPSAPALMNSDWAPEEFPTASGINCYDYLNLSTALSAICRKTTEEEMHVEMLQKKGCALYKKFHSLCNLSFFSKKKLSSNRDDLKAQLIQSERSIHFIYSDKIRAFRVPKRWQSDLIAREDFMADASSWADNFCKEQSSITKLNRHRDTVSKLVQKYHPHAHEPVDFLAALLKAANNPGIVTAIALIERESVGWKISEGFFGDTPVSAKHRTDDLKHLQALIDLLDPILVSDLTKDS